MPHKYTPNIDPQEADNFNRMAQDWWNPEGPCRPLHDLNPARLEYILKFTPLDGKQVIDIGCGGGLLSEAMAKKGAHVTALDIAEDAIAVAKDHCQKSQLTIRYLLETAEEHALTHTERYDSVVCMELLEHVPDPNSLILACRKLLKPGGGVFLSTINRTGKSYLGAIVGAEYFLNLLPYGTHDYAQFIRPSELCDWCRNAGIRIENLSGLSYNPLTRTCRLTDRPDINYLAHGVLTE